MSPNSFSNLEKEEQSMRDPNTWYQTILQGQCNKNSLVLALRTDTWKMEQSREPRNKPKYLGKLIFDKGGMSIQWSKDSLFNKWCWENWTGTCKKMKVDHQLTPHTRINSKWVKDLNISCDTLAILEANRKGIFRYPMLQYMFWYILWSKEKINNWHYIKRKSFYTTRETIINMKRELTIWENIFANDISDEGLISKIYKEFIWLNTRKTNNPIKKWAKDLNRHFSKEDIQMARRHMKRCSTSLTIRET